MTDPRRGPPPTSPPAARSGAVPTADTFLQTLLRSQLLDTSKLDFLVAAAPTAARADARALADHLIAAGALSHYQADKLLGGRWQGLVLGPYHILAPLGRGGMGTVYLARDHSGLTGGADPPLVALKVLPPKRAREEAKTLLRFRREMDLGRHLAHPHVTRTFAAGEVHGVHYIAMEYVPGETVRQAVGAGGPLAVADAARVFADVAAGLAHAHGRGLIHRDLKPSNVMMTPDGRGKVLDLGMALLVDEVLPDDPSIVGGEGYILGTMDYIAPEQTSDATNVGPRSDLYALGCSLFYAVTGGPPFPGGTGQQKMRWHRTSAPPAANQINPAVPAGFAALIERLMAKRPDDRPASADEARGLLLPWAGEPIAHAAGGGGTPTDRAAVAEIDRRAHDPSLWDAIPVAELADPDVSPRRPRGKTTRADALRWRQVVLFALAAGGIGLGLAALAVLFGILRRL